MNIHLPPFQVGERERNILRALARYRFLSFPQIAALDGGSEQHLSRRIRLMLLHELIAEPATQTTALRLVTLPRIFALSPAGAKLLSQSDGIVVERRTLMTANARATAELVAHTIGIADTMLRIAAEAPAGGCTLLDHHDLLPLLPEATRGDRTPFALRLDSGRNDVPHAVYPDRVFALLAAGARYNFTLEHDTGTMPVRRKALVGTSSFAKKIYVYWHAWARDEHQRRWGFQRFRVLTVTPSTDRIGHIVEHVRLISGRAKTGLFLFSTPELIGEHGALGPAWLDMTGARVALLAPSPPVAAP